jgi:YfiH family protein
MGLGQNPSVALQHRQQMCALLGVDMHDLVLPQQIHGNQVAIVTEKDRGRGALPRTEIPSVDGLVTSTPYLPVMAVSADCPLIGLFDPVSESLGIVHAGWRGTVQAIASVAVHTMGQAFGAKPENIIAAIAPSIGPCCYEVGDEVIERVKNLPEGNFLHGKEDHFYLDLWAANFHQLVRSGVQKEHIECANLCTRCHSDHFFSYRREGKNTGRFAFVLEKRT